jgi:hypothetical protein
MTTLLPKVSTTALALVNNLIIDTRAYALDGTPDNAKWTQCVESKLALCRYLEARERAEGIERLHEVRP